MEILMGLMRQRGSLTSVVLFRAIMISTLFMTYETMLFI